VALTVVYDAVKPSVAMLRSLTNTTLITFALDVIVGGPCRPQYLQPWSTASSADR